MRVRVVPYDPAWVDQASEEAGLICASLPGICRAIHHIGSTAIPGIYAKPVLDFLLEVAQLDKLDRSPALQELGYEAMGEYGIPGRRYFRKADQEGVRTHQVHAFSAGSEHIQRHLAFRDFMRAHPDQAEAYGRLKRALAAAHPDDMQAYVQRKEAPIQAWQAQALAWYQDV